MSARRVLVIGARGFFGAAVARRLASDARFEVLAPDRESVDVAAPGLAARVQAMRPWLVVHAAGPYRPEGYAVARAAIAARSHYVDLADNRRFVCDIGAFDADARERGLLVVSGASSVPALSAAVVDRHVAGFARLTHIDMGITSSSRMPGLGTVRSVLAYAGQPIERVEGGAPRMVSGWCGLRRRRFVHAPLARWFCDCDVPDLELFPRRYRDVVSVRFSAGTAHAPVQWALRALAGATRAGVVRDPAAWAPLLRAAGGLCARVDDGRSAMYVTLRGFDRSGAALARHWELHATGHSGAEVPALAAVALAHKLASGTLTARGAMPCVGLLSLDDWAAWMDAASLRTCVD